MENRKPGVGSLARQIDLARKNIESWPSWLRESARFEGDNHSFDRKSEADSRQKSQETPEKAASKRTR